MSSPNAHSDAARIRILLIDDNPYFLRITSRFLQSHAHNVEIVGKVSHGEEVLSSSRDLQPDLILLEPHTPHLQGLQTIRQLKAQLPRVRVIVFTVYDTPTFHAGALAAGADGFVSKMALMTDLLPAIRRVVGDTVG